MKKNFFFGCITTLLILLATLSVGLLFVWHQQSIQVVRITIPVERLPAAWESTRIGLISDLHIGVHMNAHRVQRVVRRLNALAPDFIVIAGDTVDVKVNTAAEAAAALRALHDLQTPLGVYHVFGNHDTKRAALWRPLLQEGAIKVLENEHVRLRRQDQDLYIVGLTDVLYTRPDVDKAWRGVPKDACVILAVHEPDFADQLTTVPISLQVSGHSHGGQIVIPFIPPRYLPPLGRKYVSGLYETDAGHPLYTTRGVGTSQIPFRLFARPEITIITLKKS